MEVVEVKFKKLCQDESKWYQNPAELFLPAKLSRRKHSILDAPTPSNFKGKATSKTVMERQEMRKVLRDKLQQIVITNTSFSFGLYSILSKIAVVLLVCLLTELLFYFSDLSSASILHNSLVLYSTLVSAVKLQLAIHANFLTLLSVPIDSDQRALYEAKFLNVLDAFESEIPPTLDMLRSQNLGTLNPIYSALCNQETVCSLQRKYSLNYFAQCGYGALNIFESSFISYTQKSYFVQKEAYEVWKRAISNGDNPIKAVFTQPAYKGWMSYTLRPGGVLRLYFSRLQPALLIELESALGVAFNPSEPDKAIKLIFYWKFYGSIYLTAMVFFYFMGIKPLFRVYKGVQGLIHILPLKLLQTNSLLVKELKSNYLY
mgnify:CR=1 FL=1|jgi:hypothetical protein